MASGNLLDSMQVEMERDLGVYIDSLLKFRQHTAAVIAKANRVLAVICCSFALINELRRLFFCCTNPVCLHLEYRNLVWEPFNRADQKGAERVQRRATRLVSSIRHLDYQHRLCVLKLPSLY